MMVFYLEQLSREKKKEFLRKLLEEAVKNQQTLDEETISKRTFVKSQESLKKYLNDILPEHPELLFDMKSGSITYPIVYVIPSAESMISAVRKSYPNADLEFLWQTVGNIFMTIGIVVFKHKLIDLLQKRGMGSLDLSDKDVDELFEHAYSVRQSWKPLSGITTEKVLEELVFKPIFGIDGYTKLGAGKDYRLTCDDGSYFLVEAKNKALRERAERGVISDTSDNIGLGVILAGFFDDANEFHESVDKGQEERLLDRLLRRCLAVYMPKRTLDEIIKRDRSDEKLELIKRKFRSLQNMNHDFKYLKTHSELPGISQ